MISEPPADLFHRLFLLPDPFRILFLFQKIQLHRILCRRESADTDSDRTVGDGEVAAFLKQFYAAVEDRLSQIAVFRQSRAYASGMQMDVAKLKADGTEPCFLSLELTLSHSPVRTSFRSSIS